MKKNLQFALVITLLLGLTALPILNQKGAAMSQGWVYPPTETPAPTQPPWNWVPDNGDVVNQQETPPPSGEPLRPLLYIVEYHTSLGGKSVDPYGTFGLTFTVGNNGRGGAHARNIVMTFTSQDFDPLDGSVITFHEVDSNNDDNVTRTHTFRVNDMSTWKYSGLIQAVTTYTDPDGNPYSDTFVFNIIINQIGCSGSSAATSIPSTDTLTTMDVNS